MGLEEELAAHVAAVQATVAGSSAVIAEIVSQIVCASKAATSCSFAATAVVRRMRNISRRSS